MRRVARDLFGVRPFTAVFIWAEMGDTRRFCTSNDAVRYAGLDITVYSSDDHRAAGHLARQGPGALRWALYEAAKNASRAASPDHAYYSQARARLGAHRATLSWPANWPANRITSCVTPATTSWPAGPHHHHDHGHHDPGGVNNPMSSVPCRSPLHIDDRAASTNKAAVRRHPNRGNGVRPPKNVAPRTSPSGRHPIDHQVAEADQALEHPANPGALHGPNEHPDHLGDPHPQSQP